MVKPENVFREWVDAHSFCRFMGVPDQMIIITVRVGEQLAAEFPDELLAWKAWRRVSDGT